MRLASGKQFDEEYRSKISPSLNPVAVEQGVYPLNTGKKVPYDLYVFPNPWLRYLNTVKHLENLDVWRSKYIFYGGYNDNSNNPLDETQHWANRLSDEGKIGWADNPVYFNGVYDVGYINDAPVPVSSSFFDVDIRVTSPEYANWPGDEPQEKVTMFGDFVNDRVKNVFISKNPEGFRTRFFRDYHHDRMLNGAYNEKPNDLIQFQDLSAPEIDFCYTDNLGIVTCYFLPRFDTGFETTSIRKAYIKEAGDEEEYSDDQLTVALDKKDRDSQWIDTLQYEPLFIRIERDLRQDEAIQSPIPVSIEEENNSPNNGDANGDGLLDSQQENVASLKSAQDVAQYISVVTTGSKLSYVSIQTETYLGSDPLYVYPHGVVSFDIENIVPGSTENIRVYFHDFSGDIDKLVYRKFDRYTGEYYTLPNVIFGTASIGGNIALYADLSITDGGLGDADLTVNGIIKDPGGPALPDNDNDGMGDQWEIDNGLDPNNGADANWDNDSDGLSNLQEFQFATNPNATDTDGDGISDGDEIAIGTDPTVNESTSSSTKVPVHHGLWLIPSMLTGLYLLRRRKSMSA